MRIAIVSAPKERKSPPDYVKSLARGMLSLGHYVDIIDAWTEDGIRLPSYEYIAVVAEPASIFSGKICEKIPSLLAAGSTLVGKKSAAFVKKSGFFSNRALHNLMKAMEKEGMLINWSNLLINQAHAEALGKHLGI